LVRASDEFEVLFPTRSDNPRRNQFLSGNSLLSMRSADDSSWIVGSTYLQIQVEGFAGHIGETMPLFNAEAALKAFCGLGMGLHLFKKSRVYRPVSPNVELLVHRQVDANWNIVRKFALSTSAAETFSDLVMENLGGEFPEEAQKEWIASRMNLVTVLLSQAGAAERVILGAQWLFDSYGGRNELLSFIQAMVVLEILFGEAADRTEIGLGELLRNRCAYMIGVSNEQRTEILKDFAEIYKIRSQIVHRGKARLSAKERALFSRLQWLCRRAIQEEVKLFAGDSKQG
jgi:hypothetical protein